MNDESRKLVLSLETLMRLDPANEVARPTGGTHPTTTVNTIHTGCC